MRPIDVKYRTRLRAKVLLDYVCEKFAGLQMEFESFQAEFAQIVGVDASEVEMGTELSSLKSWDSMAVMMYMSLAEEKEGHTVDPEAISSSRTVGDLFRLMG